MGNIRRIKTLYSLSTKKNNSSLLNETDLYILNECKHLVKLGLLQPSFAPTDYVSLSQIQDKETLLESINSLIRFNYLKSSAPNVKVLPNDPAYNGVTYFIKDTVTNNIKIGISSELKTRLRQLKVANPHIELIGYVKGNYEESLHACFDKNKISGEWFSISFSEIESFFNGDVKIWK